MSDKDGGPAFPALDYYAKPDGSGGVRVSDGGMSLRDYFAAQALIRVYHDGGRYGSEGLARVATQAYAMADAMLKAREE